MHHFLCKNVKDSETYVTITDVICDFKVVRICNWIKITNLHITVEAKAGPGLASIWRFCHNTEKSFLISLANFINGLLGKISVH